MKENKQQFIELHNQGKSYEEIGKIFNISKQRVHQIIKEYSSPDKRRKIKTNHYRITKGLWKKGMDGRSVLAEVVRKRDNHTCLLCGKVWHEGQRRFDVHHLDEESENDKSCDNYKKFNRMITLCHKCHLNLKHIKDKMSKNWGLNTLRK